MLKIMALETSGYGGAVALAEGDRILHEITLAATDRTARALTPAIRDALMAVRWMPSDVQLIAVTQGPGSFTGLRVGVITAKTMAYALRAEVLGVDTLEVLANEAVPDAVWIVSILDAQRKELFAATFQRDASGVACRRSETRIVTQQEWLASLPENAAIVGPGLKILTAQSLERLHAHPKFDILPTAAAVARLAWRKHSAGGRGDLWTLSPLYLRASAAEEKSAMKPA